METLNRKVVDFDGDIPIEKLMELQKKLKNKEPQEEAKTKTFVTKKTNPPQINQPIKTPFVNTNSNQGQSANQQFFNLSQPEPQKSWQSPAKQKQETISSNSFWGSVPAPKPFSAVKKTSGDDFADFFGGGPKPS